MKRKIILGFVVFMILTCFLGCSNPSNIPTEDFYKIEAGVITNQTYKAAMNMASSYTELSYSENASIRRYLYNNTIPSSHEVITDVTTKEIKDFLLSHNSSNYETEYIIKSLKEVGNSIVFFEYVYDDGKKVWVYATK